MPACRNASKWEYSWLLLWWVLVPEASLRCHIATCKESAKPGARKARRSLRLDASVLHEPCVTGELLARRRGELLRTRAAHREALVAQLRAHVRVGEGL